MMMHITARRSSLGQILIMIDVLKLIMMKLGVVDFLAFSRVCKSWRSLAVTNRNMFIVSKPPMSIRISTNANTCWLKDFEGRKFKTTIPHSTRRTCIGVTCGYVILFGRKTCDFWLVNPITRHELHFPNIPDDLFCFPPDHRAILVFSPSISRWVFVVFKRCYNHTIWFSISGNREWTKLSTSFPINDLIAFKGKIYTLHSDYDTREVRLCEMKLYPEPELVLIKTKSFPKPDFVYPEFASSGENLYVIDLVAEYRYRIYEIDLDEMKWVSREKTRQEYGFLLNELKAFDLLLYRGLFRKKSWYFFHDCLNVHIIHE